MPIQTEQRDTPRRVVEKPGQIVFNGGRSAIACTVVNLSARGAKLQVSSVVGVPDTFDLVLSGNQKQPCRVRWRRLKSLGVGFRKE
jgi:hypothetical protein